MPESCPKCGGRMFLEGKGPDKEYVCVNCGYRVPASRWDRLKRETKK